MSVSRVFSPRIRAAAILSLLSILVAACQSDRIVTGTVASDYRARHPIQLNEGIRSVLIHVGSGRASLTPEHRALAGQFGANWRREGSGVVNIEIPAGVPNEFASGHSVRELRSILAASGVPPRAIVVRTYQSAEPTNLGAIRLAYGTVRAQVASRCHAGTEDLGPTYDFRSIQNHPYANFGCATQHNLAAAVANPEDLVQPRAETPAYAARRRTVMDKYRQGQDPSTAYSSSSAGRVSTVGQ